MVWSGPELKVRPSGATSIHGYSGWARGAASSLRMLPSVARTSGTSARPWVATSTWPELISISPLSQRGHGRDTSAPPTCPGPGVQVLVAKSKMCVCAIPSSRAPLIPARGEQAPVRRGGRGRLQKMLKPVVTVADSWRPVSGSQTVARVKL